MTCPSIRTANSEFTSSVTGRVYNIINGHDDKTVTCNSNNVIYLMTCKTCGVQYVGETVQCFRIRMNGHRTSFKTNKRCLLYRHSHGKECGNNRFDHFHTQPIKLN